jgi:hypothetical protein
MAAFGASTVTATEVKGRYASSATKFQKVYARTFQFTIPASVTVAAATLTGLTLPPGSFILGGVVSPSQSLGSTTLAFTTVTSNVIFSAATAYTAEAALTNSISLCVPSSATADDTVTCTTAAATAPGTDTVVTVTLFIAPFGKETPAYTTYNN